MTHTHRITAQAAARAAAVMVAAGALVAGCGSRPAPHVSLPAQARGVAAIEPDASPRPYAAADLAFGLDLLGAWCRQDSTGNIVLSPSSVASGLGMAYLGARGSTARAMAAVLHLPSTGSVEAGLQARSRALGRVDGPGVTVDTADHVWADPRLLPLRSYLNAVATGYGASVGRVALLTDPARAASQIDASVAAATKGHITRLLTAQGVANSVFVLTDALYLDARWATPFEPDQTSTGQFTTPSGEHVRAHFLTSGGLTSVRSGGWTAVSLPYQDGKLTMTAVLPPAATSAAGCPGLSAAALAAMARTLDSGHGTPGTTIMLPEISLRGQQHLNGLLTKLGMGVAFGGDANFTGMSPVAGYIGSVEHAATLRVDAAGTVASAATGVVIMPASAPATGRTVVFSRPYLLLISATGSGEPLFLARVANPGRA
jgi:serine protease inhibitor